ncbi:MAG: DUF1501 domain-containing protein [Planctomycetota bacterium]
MTQDLQQPVQLQNVLLEREQAERCLLSQTRRKFLTSAFGSLGTLALGTMVGPKLMAAPSKPSADTALTEALPIGARSFLTHAPKAKRVIHLCMAGGPSHLETFDYKPTLDKMHDQPMPESLTAGQPIAQLQGKALKAFKPQTTFSKCGESGTEIADIFPHIQSIADDICVIKSMRTEQINHDPAHTFFNTGTIRPHHPSIGSWLLYGLGSMNQNLPGYVVLTSWGGGQGQPISARQWHNGFLDSKYQGVKLNAVGDPVYYVGSPDGVSNPCQSEVIEAINQLNQDHARVVDDPEIASRIAQYELAFRMQVAVPELTDFSKEDPKVVEEYGCKPGDGTFASNCLMARRLAERGVRFIQLYHRGWDHHGGLHKAIRGTAGNVDQATAALINDLKHRGMLDETLIIWGGEFGRTPMAQGTGRDHHIKGYSMFMAGGGVKPGIAYGNTDEFGYNATENIVHVRDLHATMLHQLGIDHQRLTFKHQGLDAKLTGVEPAKVVRDILA